MKILLAVATLALAAAYSDKHSSEMHIVIVDREGVAERAATCKLTRTDPNAPKHFWLECNDKGGTSAQ